MACLLLTQLRVHISMASRSAAAEARRRKILERGTDRLNRITLGSSTGTVPSELCAIGMALACLHCSAYWYGMGAGFPGAQEQPHGLGGALIASSAINNADKEHSETLQEPAIPLTGADQGAPSDTVNVRSGAAETTTEPLKEQENLLGGSGSHVQGGRQKPAQHALPSASHKWAQYESSSALPVQQSANAKPLTTLQASSLLTQLTHSRSMLCLMAPQWQLWPA